MTEERLKIEDEPVEVIEEVEESSSESSSLKQNKSHEEEKKKPDPSSKIELMSDEPQEEGFVPIVSGEIGLNPELPQNQQTTNPNVEEKNEVEKSKCCLII
ncbi:hypothetical protein TVAG_107390 [Trichomonas vaginalis G3]|uniref:Uncharacterized protein n=1 Tax=Trichomonas vaginalis (strain ATCC PRA-98 / G3) TaxID=412133 RepID=A2FSB8_TRIV3|nr:hypothetical protein TVAGG3_0093470 [Trichomonas vaginalis G3]EAX92205.1 hypothetical protein TVAG_107390 [Trichomonas vaginalis G3]KAI5543995.1 hypothetical protein TVAGG3_0093470 [Trichomonas vaginalis G3]|eukprot:XP_001305135.1 hypothetical protein [Trichomonas vaginalis G3]